MSDGNKIDQSTDEAVADRKKSLTTGLLLLLGGGLIFGVCSLVQHSYDSSMFETSYSDPGFLGSILLNLTFWPGWAITAGMIGLGLIAIANSLSKK